MSKFKIILIVVFIFLLTSFSVYADNDGYIVKIPQLRGISLMSAMPDDAEYYGNGIYVVETYEEAQALSPYAEYIEPNHTVYLHNSYDYSTLALNNYILNQINMQPMWDFGCHGNDVLVGVIDSGCNSHNLLNSALVEGRNFLATTEEGKTDVTDNVGHGTFVSGLIAARYGGANVIGMAHHAKIMPLKIFDGGNSTDAAVSNAIYYAADNGCKIVNMSFGTPDYSRTMKIAIDYACGKGVIFVASVGNNAQGNENASNPNFMSYPASLDNVIGVGATDSDGNRAAFSHYNASVFVMAPGKAVKSTAVTGKGGTQASGTSFSAPIVSGVIADMFSIDESLTLDEVKNIIINTSNRENHFAEGEIRNDEYGYGIIDAGAIANYMLSGKEWFISPLDLQTDIPEITIFKNTDENMTPVAVYQKNDGTYSLNNLEFTGRGTQTVRFDEAENYELMIIKDLYGIMPLIPKIIY